MRLLINFLLNFWHKSRLCDNRNTRLPGSVLRNVVAFMATTRTMSEKLSDTFQGVVDRFHGVTVDSELENCDFQTFPDKIENSLKKWREEGKRGVWFKIDLDHSDWVPVLAKKGFRFHHAQDNFVMMYLWLPLNENCNIPPYAHTMIGVGAVVVDDKSQILVVSEKYYKVPHWKLPGGYVEPGENLVDAAIREVWEETGIKTEFKSVLSLRQGHHGMFGCSDIYTVVSLKPLTFDIDKCDREIANCQWMDINEYLKHPHVHELNRLFVEKYLEYKEKQIKIDWYHGIHQVLQKPYTVYYVTDDNDNKK